MPKPKSKRQNELNFSGNQK